MARGEIYQKFDNISGKITPELVIGRKLEVSDYKNPQIQNIIRNCLKENIAKGVESLTHKELEGKKYTLGYEIETVMGRLDPEDYNNLNIKAVHDGSLRNEEGDSPTGGEYVTGVLYGDSGFKQLYDICKVLNEHCDIDHRAGIHIHIGSLDWSDEDIVYAYLLAELIEQDMFKLLPSSRSKNKYCRKLNKVLSGRNFDKDLLNSINDPLTYQSIVNMAYNVVFQEVSGGFLPGNRFNKRSNHPKGSKCGYDTSSQRYCWLNFVTLIFNTKDSMAAKTLEIRSHSATMNYTKIKNWAKIWCAFCHFVTNNKRAILEQGFVLNGQFVPLTLDNICKWSYPKSGHKLVEYMNSRRKLFLTKSESVDWTSESVPEKSITEVLELN